METCADFTSYYINAPGVPASKGCVWGTITEPIGNWSPYVAGANTVANGQTYVKIAWNPEFLAAPLAKTLPSFGLKIECPDGGCNGLPCSIDPSKDGVNGLSSSVGTKGVGDANFCVVTVPKGKTANIVVFNTDGSEGPATSAKPSSQPPPTTSTVAKPTSTSTTSVALTSSSSAGVSSTTPFSSSTTSDVFVGGLFQEDAAEGETRYYNSTVSSTAAAVSTTGNNAPAAITSIAPSPSNNDAAADQGGSAIAGLVVALVAAAALI
jgi:hypothetical protein